MSNVTIQSGLPDVADADKKGGDFGWFGDEQNLTTQDGEASATSEGGTSDRIDLAMTNPSQVIPAGGTPVSLGFLMEYKSGAGMDFDGFVWPREYVNSSWSDFTTNHGSLSESTFDMNQTSFTQYSALIEIGGSGYNTSKTPQEIADMWNNGEMGLSFEAIVTQVIAGDSVTVRNFQLQIEYEEPVTRRRVLLTQIL